jgi:hypothetical protein
VADPAEMDRIGCSKETLQHLLHQQNSQEVSSKTKIKLRSESDPTTEEAASTQEQTTEVAATRRERSEKCV